MTNKSLHPFHLLICLSMLFSNSSLAQITDWQVDPTNTTQYQVPRGWKVNVSQEQGVYVWQAMEDPTNPLGADISVLTMQDFPNSSPTFFINQLESTIQGFQILETKQVSSDEYHYQASGKMEGAQISCNLIFLRDRNSQFLYLASFSAKQQHYQRLGGPTILYRALQRINPFATDAAPPVAPAPAPSGNTDVWNMQSLEAQNYLRTQGLAPQKNALLGEWLQAFSYQTGTAAQDIVSGQISFGERGYGHLLTFKADDTYQQTYKYNSVSQGCKYQADFFEKGRFSIQGQQVVLYPSRYEGTYNICNKVSPETNTNPPTRYFDLYLDQEGKRLLVIGPALEYSISSETDANGNNYIQEGFNKTQ